MQSFSIRSYFNLTVITNSLLFLFPIGINTLKGSGDLVLLCLAIIGGVQFFRGKASGISQKSFRWFCIAMLGYFAVLVVSVVFSGKPAELARYLARDLHFLFAPLILLALISVRVNTKLVFLGVKLSLVLMGLIVSYQWFDGQSRPSGVMNVGTFGNLAVMTLFFLLVYSLVYLKEINFLSILSIVCGVVTVVLSETRGAFFSAMFMLLISSWLALKYVKINRKALVIFLSVCCMAILLIGTFSDSVKNRITQAHSDITYWSLGENYNTSVGLRLEMYKSSLLAISDMPLVTGYGYRNANPVVAQYADISVRKKIAEYNHLHNAYISSLLFNGVLGLLALILILFLPMVYFYQRLASKDSQLWGMSGLLLCLGYASFGLVNILFGDVFMNAFYVFFITLFFSQAISQSYTTNEEISLDKSLQ